MSTQSSGGSYRFGDKLYCKHMHSCEKAMFHLDQWGGKSLDRDKDGVPVRKSVNEMKRNIT